MKKKIESLLLKIFNKLCKRNIREAECDVINCFRNDDVINILQHVSKKKQKTVAFFCMGIPMWKYESLFNSLVAHPDFHPLLFIAPRESPWEERKVQIKSLENYCKSHNYEYVPLKNNFFNIGQNLENYDIDIAFFTQPYANVICKEYGFEHLKHSLLCYVPYGYYLSHQAFCYTSLLNKIAWRNFYPAEYAIDEVKSFNQNDSNVVITGYPGYDMYCSAEPLKWKDQNKRKIIWAPHFSVAAGGWMHLSSFMEVYDYMIELTRKYKDDAVFAFKPHPNLYSALCNEWGEEKTYSYYQRWSEGVNTMLCTADNYPLFKSSDAMIHDSGSFLMEYLYTQKPCMYLYLNSKNNFNLNEAGVDAMSAHYKAYTKADIEDFVKMIITGGDDTLLNRREEIVKKYIIPQNGRTATDNILTELEKI